jgi:hypothetical protein
MFVVIEKKEGLLEYLKKFSKICLATSRFYIKMPFGWGERVKKFETSIMTLLTENKVEPASRHKLSDQTPLPNVPSWAYEEVPAIAGTEWIESPLNRPGKTISEPVISCLRCKTGRR